MPKIYSFIPFSPEFWSAITFGKLETPTRTHQEWIENLFEFEKRVRDHRLYPDCMKDIPTRIHLKPTKPIQEGFERIQADHPKWTYNQCLEYVFWLWKVKEGFM